MVDSKDKNTSLENALECVETSAIYVAAGYEIY